MFRNDKFGKFQGFGHPKTIYSNISKIRLLIQMTFCGNAKIQMDLSKKNRFSTEEAISHLPRTEKRKKVKCT